MVNGIIILAYRLADVIAMLLALLPEETGNVYGHLAEPFWRGL